MVAAHLGGWSIYQEAVPYMESLNCYMDLSSVMAFIPPEQVLAYIRLYGADRLLFGSDFPMFHPVQEWEAFMKLPLTDDEREKILYRNAAHVFGISVP